MPSDEDPPTTSPPSSPVVPPIVPPVTSPTTTPPVVPSDLFGPADTVIVDISFNQIIDGSGVEIINQGGKNVVGEAVAKTVLTTVDVESDIQITQDLSQVIQTYDDTTNAPLLMQIRDYASQLQCSKFHGNGSIEDYTELFKAASQIAHESKQMQLSVDVDGFNEFADAAEQLSTLFTGFIFRLQNVNVINDAAFLNSILSALKKIVHLSNTFGKFKESIIATSLIEIPKSCHDASVILQSVMTEINCAVDCINYFANPTSDIPTGAELEKNERDIIDAAVNSIKQWNILCEQGVTIAMSNNPDVQNITRMNSAIKTKTSSISHATAVLSTKFSSFHL
jgi:hypothetical protein